MSYHSHAMSKEEFRVFIEEKKRVNNYTAEELLELEEAVKNYQGAECEVCKNGNKV